MSFCHEGLATKAEQPLPAPDQARSLYALPDLVSDVPPTAVTYCDAAGNSTP